MRKATQLWEMYRDSGQAQDIMETALGAIVAAGGQALLTDMSAEEIAKKAIKIASEICVFTNDNIKVLKI